MQCQDLPVNLLFKSKVLLVPLSCMATFCALPVNMSCKNKLLLVNLQIALNDFFLLFEAGKYSLMGEVVIFSAWG